MKINWLKPLGAALFLLMLCLRPADALSAASQSLTAWALSVSPALLPFLIAAPALTCQEVCSLFTRFSGPFLRFMRLPENSTGALLIGLLSGSPAGAAALASVPPSKLDPPGAYLRAALMASGASPAFLLTGVAVSMLNAPEAGGVLLRSQLLSVLLTSLLFRSFGSGMPSACSSAQKQHGVILSAMLTLLTIGGYMVFFSILARLLASFMHPSLETPLLAVLELAGGCRALASLPFDLSRILPLISAAACFGGVSVYMQCMSFLSVLNVDPAEYAAGKLLQSALAAVFTHFQLNSPLTGADPLIVSMLTLSILILFLIINLIRFRLRPESREAVFK